MSGASRGKFFVVPLHFFGSTYRISRFGERFRDGQYILVSFLFGPWCPPPCPVVPASLPVMTNGVFLQYYKQVDVVLARRMFVRSI